MKPSVVVPWLGLTISTTSREKASTWRLAVLESGGQELQDEPKELGGGREAEGWKDGSSGGMRLKARGR